MAFDVELNKLVPPYNGEMSWEHDNMPRVTCAATYNTYNGITQVYWTPARDGKRLAAPVLAHQQVESLIHAMYNHVCYGGVLVSWGGTAVDFRALHASCNGDKELQNMCIYLAHMHIDIPFASATDSGCMFSLNSAAKAMGFTEKDASISSAAPQLWDSGHEVQVLGHVLGDAVLTASLYLRTMEWHHQPTMQWVTQRGKTKSWKPSLVRVQTSNGNFSRMNLVQECMQRPKPSVPFVTPHGLDRDCAIKWMEKLVSGNAFA